MEKTRRKFNSTIKVNVTIEAQRERRGLVESKYKSTAGFFAY